jgi:dTDP-4-dehydrorhamnose reductase|tara:strand:- start:1884 stop:2828 length:945 start_codon:yes stop_codon:yes gene_type:complete
MKKKVFVSGANGLLGSKIVHLNNENYSFIGGFNQTNTNIENINSIQLDITKFNDCKKILDINPDFIIHTAAITDVDYCEKNNEEAYCVNVQGTKNLCKIAQNLNCKIIYISTDGVFSGDSKNNKESDICNPLNYYGKTKLEGENEIRKLDNYLILRSNVLYGFESLNSLKSRSKHTKSINFALWILTKLNKNEQLRIVDDQISNPTYVDNLVKIIFDCLKKNINGIFHATDITCINRYEFTKKVASKFGFSDDLISNISSNELNQFAKRPLNTCLDCSKLIQTGVQLSSLDESLEKLYNQINKFDSTLIHNTMK